MIVIQETFIAKPGNASKLAKMFKETMGSFPEVKSIMTDMTGQFNRVIITCEYESLRAYEESWEKYSQDSEEMKKMQEAMKDYTEMYQTGSREIYKVW